MALARELTLGVSRNHAKDAVPEWPRLLAEGIAAGLGSPVRVEVAEEYEELLELLLSGAVDLSWLPPLLHAKAAASGARLIALPQRGGWLTFRSAILVRKDDPVRSAGALRAARAAWRDRNSASGYLFPRLELATLGATPDKAYKSEQFYGSVVDAADSVARGDSDVCTCFVSDPAARDPQRARKEIERSLGPAGQHLRVLHVTDPIPPDGFVVAPAMPDAEREEVKAALLRMHETKEGKAALSGVLQAERLAPVNDALLRSLRSWSEAAAARA